jgi:hypothetical protein
MPRDDISYSNTVIYKIYCKDPTIKDIYVGHTTNFTKRKYHHKVSCKEETKLKIYDTIRRNGGWENWNMEELARYPCTNSAEAKMKEQYHYGLLTQTRPLKKKHVSDTYDIPQQITPELVLSVLQQNKDLTDLVLEQNKTIMELAKNGQGQVINSNNHVNSNNKTFNLNVFLNETCKDAMNIMEFVDSLQLQLSDLENMGKVGYVEGISSIIVKNLQAMDVHKRPVHCADKKREVIYIKDEDKWEREDDDKKKLRKVIKKVACKNQRLLPKFKEAHPGCNFSDSQYSDHYSKLVIEAMGGAGNNDTEKEDKIIRNIAKEIVIDKR